MIVTIQMIVESGCVNVAVVVCYNTGTLSCTTITGNTRYIPYPVMAYHVVAYYVVHVVAYYLATMVHPIPHTGIG